ncbi:MAG: leucine-rich repeat protein, partial [Clostridia bacterium]|nr:leucine-rich repeat protein [Clostridia bacterium]
MKKVIITSFAVILAVALCIPIYAALSSKIEASMTDHETGYEEETGEPFGRAPAYVMIRCGKNQIYPESYFKGSVTYQEEGDPVTEAGTGADGVDYAVSIAYNRGDTLSVYYENYGNVIYVSYRQQGREDHNYSDESFINSFLETAENGVYRFIVTVALTGGNKIEEWEYPFDVEVCKEELVGLETDGVIYTDYGSYCVVSGHTESVSENVVIRSFVDFDGRQLPVRAIGEKAFAECADIKSVTLPDGLIEIGKQAFWRCRSLQSINLPEGLKEIKDAAFGTCGSLVSVTLPDSLETLGVNAFSLCGLTSIEIPDKITSLNEIVFAGCADLKSVTIGSGVRSIHYRAFENSDGIESIIISDNNPKYHASGNCIIETNSKRLIFGTDDCVIPDDGSVTTIASRAFDYRMNLECISIPASVTKLEDRAFYGCPRLTTVYYGGTVSQWESATKTVYLENQHVLKYQCTVICSDGTVEPIVDSCIEYGTEPWDDETEPDQPQQFEKGDCNGDGAVDNKDVVALFRYVSGNNKVSDEYVYDYNNDGVVDNKDVVGLFRDLCAENAPETFTYEFKLYGNGDGNSHGTTDYPEKDLFKSEITEKEGIENKKVTIF